VVAHFTLGEHNLRDQYGLPTPFADVLLFCEAKPGRIRSRFQAWRHRRRLVVCKEQRDLVVSLPRNQFRIVETLYFKAHPGEAKVTPKRGTFVVKTVHRPTGRKVAFLLEHRINAAFPPFKRGEGVHRAELWRKHTALSLGVIAHLKHENYSIFAGGDLNTPPRVKGYGGHLVEVNSALDRLAHSRDVSLVDFERLSPVGSDHHRIKATAEL
jgi:hypothetical protein